MFNHETKGIIIPKMAVPSSLGKGLQDVRKFEYPPDYHPLIFNVPYFINGRFFWMEELSQLGHEYCGHLFIERKRRVVEVQLEIPFDVEGGRLQVVTRIIGASNSPQDIHVIRQI